MIGIGFLGKLQNLLNINLRTYDHSGYHLPGYWGYRQLTHQLSQKLGLALAKNGDDLNFAMGLRP